MYNNTDYIGKLAEKWTRCGVKSGDILLVHSSVKRTLINAKREGVSLSPDDILDSFIECLGDSGTLILPLFNFEFPSSKIFDIRNSKSQMGALTEAARKRVNVVRTGHPIYSFAVLGKEKELFNGVDNKSGYGKDSPFGLLHSLKGKIASLDLEDQNSMTFYHYIEECLGVDYRYFKTFTGEYIDESGISSVRKYKLYVRDTKKNVLTHVNPAGDLMWRQGLYVGDRPKLQSGLRTIEAVKMFNFISNLINSGDAEGNLFVYGDKR